MVTSETLESRSQAMVEALTATRGAGDFVPAPEWAHKLLEGVLNLQSFNSSDMSTRGAPAWAHKALDVLWDYFMK